MNREKDGKTFWEKLATFIVDKRNLFFFLYIAGFIFSIFSQGWVKVCDDLTAYLPAQTETRRGLTIMEEEFTTYGTARIMLSHVTYEAADEMASRISRIEGVTSVTFDRTEEHFKGADALYDVTFDGEVGDAVSVQAMEEIRELLKSYDAYISSEVGYSLADTLDAEMGVILLVAVVIIVCVLFFTSRSYAEIPVLLLTFGAAAVLNMGTNFLLGEISFVSNSVTVVLQLALAIDYAIILLHRFIEEHEVYDTRQACIRALANSIPSISASSLTTISGLMAMMFMQFRIGFDMGLALIKAILFSMLSVFTLMPGLLMLFSAAIEKTAHKSFIPKISLWGKFVVKTRYVGVAVFLVCMIGGFYLSGKCSYVYGYSTIETSKKNESQVAEEKINERFGSQNVMALIVPAGDYEREKLLLRRLKQYEQIDYAMGLSNVEAMDGYMLTDGLTPREFSEMTDIDYELVQIIYAAYAANDADFGKIVGGLDSYSVPLMDMFLFLSDQVQEGYVSLDSENQNMLEELQTQLTAARKQLLSEDYTRMLVALNLPEEGEETFAFLKTIHQEAERLYDADQVYLVGDSTSDYDLSTSFERDNIMISILSIVFVIIVLLFTFQSVGMPILLILVIQGSIWINFSFPTLTNTPIFFMSYLIVTAIQMGANIDYAIVISTWYGELKEKYAPKQAICEALNLAFPTVLTSGSILAAAGFLISKISSEASIVGIGECISRGTLISMAMVMLILPQILLLGDLIVEKTRFSIKTPALTRSASGTIYVSGHVRGKISGTVDATIHGVIHGDISAVVETEHTMMQEGENENDENCESSV